MRTRSRTLFCGMLVAATGLVCSPALAQEKASEPAAVSKDGSADLTARFKKDQELKFVQDNLRTVKTVAMGGQEFSERAQQTVGWTVKVKDVQESTTILEMKLDSLVLTVDSPQGTYQYDSTKPADDKDKQNLAYQAFRPAVGTVVTLTLDGDGNVTEVAGTERLPTAGPMGQFVQGLLSGEQIKMRWAPVFCAKDGGGQAKVGETWKDEESFKAPPIGKFVISTTSTLKGAESDTATVESSGTTDLQPLGDAHKLTFDVKDDTFKRTTTWNTKDGLPQRIEVERKFTLEGDAQGMGTIKRSTDEKMTIRRAS